MSDFNLSAFVADMKARGLRQIEPNHATQGLPAGIREEATEAMLWHTDLFRADWLVACSSCGVTVGVADPEDGSRFQCDNCDRIFRAVPFVRFAFLWDAG